MEESGKPAKLSCVSCMENPEKGYLLYCLHVLCEDCYTKKTGCGELNVECALCSETSTQGQKVLERVRHQSCDGSILNPPPLPSVLLGDPLSTQGRHNLTMNKKAQCSEHYKPIEYFCTKCNCLFCQVCTCEYQSQPCHKFKYIHSRNTQTHLQRLKQCGPSFVLNGRICSQVKEEALGLCKAIEMSKQQVLDTVDKEFALLYSLIDKRRAEIKEDLVKVMEKKMTILRDVAQTADKEQRCLSQSEAAVARILANIDRCSPRADDLVPEVVSSSSSASAILKSIEGNPVQSPHDIIELEKAAFLPSNFEIVSEALQTCGCLVYGPPLSKAKLSPLPASVTLDSTGIQMVLTLVDSDGSPWMKGETVASFLRLAEPVPGSPNRVVPSPPVKAAVQDNNDGTYAIVFENTYTGLCSVSVLVDDVHVSGSPFNVTLITTSAFVRSPTKLSSPVNFLDFPDQVNPGRLHGIAVSRISGCIYISDSLHDTVFVFDGERKHLRSLGCRGKERGQLRDPQGLALDSGDTLYIANCTNHRVEVFKPDSRCKGQIGNGKLQCPTDVAVYDKHLYVADSGNHRIAVFSLQGKLKEFFGDSTILGWPGGLAFSSSKRLYVADLHQSRIVAFDQDRKVVCKFCSKQLNAPLDLVIAENGSILVCNSGANQIAVLDGDKGHLLHSTPISSPYGMAVDANGQLLVTDYLNKRVAIF